MATKPGRAPEAELFCIECGAKFGPEAVLYRCPKCNSLLEVVIDIESAKTASWSLLASRAPGVWRYREFLPVDAERAVTLGEGATPLVRAERLAKKLGLKELYLKFEGANPTGSFKDRGMTVGVTKALELGFARVACASTGNTSASMAAYAAKAGLEAVVYLPKGKVALGKLAQALLHGAKVVEVEGSFDAALDAVLSKRGDGAYILNSVNPWRLEGQKTAAFEIAEELRGGVDWVVLPMGNCGNISAYWKGFVELVGAGLTDWLPRMAGIQAEGAAPVVKYLRGEIPEPKIDSPETFATAIRIGRPVNWPKAVRAIRESSGVAEIVSDEEILRAQLDVARLEGLAVEPASAASVAGLAKLVENGVIDGDSTVVAVLTGHGLKDPQSILKAVGRS